MCFITRETMTGWMLTSITHNNQTVSGLELQTPAAVPLKLGTLFFNRYSSSSSAFCSLDRMRPRVPPAAWLVSCMRNPIHLRLYDNLLVIKCHIKIHIPGHIQESDYSFFYSKLARKNIWCINKITSTEIIITSSFCFL